MTRHVARRMAAGALAGAATVLLAALSRAPQATGGGEEGRLRLSWSGHPERIEVCREVPEEELQALPRHMRQPVICEGRAADYHLTVTVDGIDVMDAPVTGGGLRHDRPIYVYRELPLAPGTHVLSVRFTLTDTAAASVTSARPSRLDALPRLLTFDTTIALAPRTVALVTYDAEERRLTGRTGGGAESTSAD